MVLEQALSNIWDVRIFFQDSHGPLSELSASKLFPNLNIRNQNCKKFS